MPYLYILFLSTLFVYCSSVPKEYSINNAVCHYDDPIFNITEEELILNPNILKHSKDSNGDILLTDNEKYRNIYSIFSSKNVMNYQTNKDVGVGKWILYRENRTIKSLEFRYLNGTKSIFKETHYDEQGKITEVIDYEKGYTICWAEAIEIVKKAAKKAIKKYEVTGFNLSHNNLNKFTNAKPEWQITLDGNETYKLKDIDVYRIDGVTGKFLRKTKIIITHE